MTIIPSFIRIFNSCEVLIENSVTRVIVWHGIFNLHRRTIMDSFSCRLYLFLLFQSSGVVCNHLFWGQDMGSDCISSWSSLIFLLCISELLWLCRVVALKSLPVHSFNVLIIPILRGCLQSLVLRAGYGIWLYQFLIIVYLFTLPSPIEFRHEYVFSIFR